MAAKRPKLGDQDEDDLLAYLDVAYDMKRATSRDGYDPAGDSDDKKVGGDRSEDEEDLDMLAIATPVLLSLKRRGDSTHQQAPVSGRTLCGSVVAFTVVGLTEVAFAMVEMTVMGFAVVELTAVGFTVAVIKVEVVDLPAMALTMMVITAVRFVFVGLTVVALTVLGIPVVMFALGESSYQGGSPYLI
ncbi:hypothetical protein PHYPSEUDO_006744 [Phytophthora pseudosyringae]|uniref:Transmembrane protein n=1 Tax=Phytophthora pseudosyringae TaxID=221518 RepID=A0A8T1VIE2_9STRA|nr:hypothetical protein PHYPSEUDO_006744 [Phytophthora pseudosyringae]